MAENPKEEIVKIEDELKGADDSTSQKGITVKAEVWHLQFINSSWILGVAGFFIGCTIIFVLALAFKAYEIPAPPYTAKAEDLAKYTSLMNSRRDFIISIFDSVVVKALLPIVTTVIGFLIGRQTQTKNESD
jgi:ABC-type spermidine/putrescine transport system permease subunit I